MRCCDISYHGHMHTWTHEIDFTEDLGGGAVLQTGSTHPTARPRAANKASLF